jgi:hypothetical protein
MTETLQGKGELRYGDPLSDNYIEANYHIVIDTTMRDVRSEFSPVPQTTATVDLIQPLDGSITLEPGIYYLKTSDENLKVKNLGGAIWRMLSQN